VATTTLVAKAQAALGAELQRFVAGDPDRSVAVPRARRPTATGGGGGGGRSPGRELPKLPPALAPYDAGERGEIDLDAMVTRGELGTTAYPSILAPSRMTGACRCVRCAPSV
jgi:hypothetical protein